MKIDCANSGKEIRTSFCGVAFDICFSCGMQGLQGPFYRRILQDHTIETKSVSIWEKEDEDDQGMTFVLDIIGLNSN